MKKILLLSLFMLPSVVEVTAQTATTWDDMNRYWYYRYRLVRKFLVRGEEDPLVCRGSATGYSIPASQIFSADETGNVDLYWGDATSYLGWYIAVLATEYKLLNDNGQATDATKKELYYAMKAYERLDRKAESAFYPYNSTDCSTVYLNGLFTRDDVSEDFLKTQTEFVKQFELAHPGVPFHIHSDQHVYQDPGHISINDQNSNIYPTMDQMSDLFMGFYLVRKFLGNDSYQGYNFVANAQLY